MGPLRKLTRRPLTAKIAVTFYDAVLGGVCMFVAIRARYAIEEKAIPSNIDENAAYIFAIITVIVWAVTNTHKAIWRFTSLDDVRDLLQGVLLVSIITPVVLFIFFDRAQDFPRSVPFIAGGLFFLTLLLNRLLVLFAQNGDVHAIFRGQDQSLPRAVLIGSAASLDNYIKDMRRKSTGPDFNIVGLIDVNLDNLGRSIRGLPVLGCLEDLQPVVSRLTHAEGAPPTLISTDSEFDRKKSYDLVRSASEIGAPLVRVSEGGPGALTPFEAADLIGRKVKALKMEPVKRLIQGKRVMITGAGGSIGSEITRQISHLAPASLALLDSSEFHIYEIERKLSQAFDGETPFWRPYIADVRNKDRIEEIFAAERPQIILHAAALKHVHLSEINPIETLQTNVLGTKLLLDLSVKFGVESFTLISTDKAVNASNIMGASKRVAELLTMSGQASTSKMSVSAVRFGNVLASNGSVIPLFEEQIARGGPVTVTHKDVERFFMTTEEAAALVLQAAALNSTQVSDLSSIYVLEMGNPVKIAKLARQLIRLRGKVPDRDIMIKFTNLRPGEKINEALTCKDESLESTYVEGVRCISGRPKDPHSLSRSIDKLVAAVKARHRADISRALHKLIPTYSENALLSEPAKKPKSAKIIPLAEPGSR